MSHGWQQAMSDDKREDGQWYASGNRLCRFVGNDFGGADNDFPMLNEDAAERLAIVLKADRRQLEEGMIEPEAYSVAEVAAKLACSPNAIYEACRRGEFPHVKIGKVTRIPRRRFEAWMGGEAPQTAVDSTARRH